MNFTSQICTTKKQSERLLALGLKKETADCHHWAYTQDSRGNSIPERDQIWITRIGTEEPVQEDGFRDESCIPAWSLHRLIELCAIPKVPFIRMQFQNTYDEIISLIAEAIKLDAFNKEYLEE
jgi:hypothetical protein